ncbi:hypothetical protein ACFQ95_25890, partial [Variovorax sp. HJSM1_2]
MATQQNNRSCGGSAGGTTALGRAADELKKRVDCADLALRLGMKREGSSAKANFVNPQDVGRPATLACYPAVGTKGSTWFDHRHQLPGGPIDLYMLFTGADFVHAVKELASMYGVTIGRDDQPAVKVEETIAEFIAKNCLKDARSDEWKGQLVDYLTGRGIKLAVIDEALEKKALGFNTWNSPKVPKGEPLWGGPAVAFIVRAQRSGQVVAV